MVFSTVRYDGLFSRIAATFYLARETAMLTYYSLRGGMPACLPPSQGGTESCPEWINLENPTPEECAAVSKEYGIPPDHIHAALDFNERPRVEHDDKALLIVARAPLKNDHSRRVPFSTCPVAVILTPTLVLTVCLKEGIVTDLLCRKIRGAGERLGVRLALSLLLRVSTTFIEHLRLMDERVEGIEQALQQSMQNQELIKMLHIEKSLIYFLTALKGDHSVMEKIASSPNLAVSAEERELLNDVLIENKQATDMAEIFTQIMGSLSDAFGAIVSNNLNKVMKVLTGLTIIFMIPSIVGALYGMNVPLPWQDQPHAFAILCLLSLVLALGGYWILRKMDWM